MCEVGNVCEVGKGKNLSMILHKSLTICRDVSKCIHLLLLFSMS